LPTDQADRLRAAVKAPGFKLALDRFLEKLVLDIDQWPTWQWRGRHMAARFHAHSRR
jgi:hypothetical protein